MDLVDNVGAYLRPPEPSTLYRCFGNITGAYDIAAVAIRARAVVTNRAPTGLNRGFGGQQLYFGLERLMDAVAARTGLDVAEVRRRNLVARVPAPHAHRRALRLRRLPGGARAAARQGRVRRAARAPGERPRRGRLLRASGWRWSSTRRAPTSATSASRPRPQERKPGRDKSGSTEHRPRISVDLQGVVTVLLGSVPQGQGHATVARRVGGAAPGPAGRAGARGRRHGHRHRRRGRSPRAATPRGSRRWSPAPWSPRWTGIAETMRARGRRCCSASTRPALELADGAVRDPTIRARRASSGTRPGSCTGTRGRCRRASPRGSTTEGAFTPPEAVAADRGGHDQLQSSATASSPRWSACGSTPTPCWSPSDRVATRARRGHRARPGAARGPGARRARPRRSAVRCTRSSATPPPASRPSATFLDYLCPTSAETASSWSPTTSSTPSPLTPLGAKGCGEGQLDEPAGGLSPTPSPTRSRPPASRSTRCPCTARSLHQLLTREETSAWR